MNIDNDDFIIENGELIKYKKDQEEVIIPEGVLKIGNGVFKEKKLKKLLLLLL